MDRVNLLPWREEQAKSRQKQDRFILFSSIVFTILFLIAWHLYLSHQIKRHRLPDETETILVQISSLQKMINIEVALQTKIKLLLKQREQPRDLLIMLSHIIPNGVYLTSFELTAEHLTLAGRAISITDLRNFSNALIAAKSFGNIEWQEIKIGTEASSQFRLESNPPKTEGQK